jgi:nitrite reductase/ring-hydroxylating ferredoxin subunit/uncharacterized protein YbjT (DUF2867 family)
MRTIVIAGHSVIAPRLVTSLQSGGHNVVAASPDIAFDRETGEGLSTLLHGADVVVDLSDLPIDDTEAAVQRFVGATRTLLDHEVEAGVAHHVALTPLGTSHLLDGGWFRGGLAREQLIRHTSVPASIVRTAPWFELLDTVADVATRGHEVRVPPVLVQPVAADDVVRLLAALADGPPLNGAIEIGGPEPFYLDAVLERLLGARRDARQVVVDAHAQYLGSRLEPRSLVAGDEAELGEISFDGWLRALLPQRADAAATCGTMGGALEFCVSDIPPGSALRVGEIAVFNVGGVLCATQATCTHKGGPLSEGALEDGTVTCPLHGARFDVWTGAALRGPAQRALETYPVVVEGDVGRVMTDPAMATLV